MPAINRRRGSAAILMRGLSGGAPFCSGGNLRIGSANALLLSWWFAGGILDGVAHVFLDLFQLGQQAMGVGRIDAVECGGRQFGAQPAQFAEQRAGGLAQIEPVDAAVAVVAAALAP